MSIYDLCVLLRILEYIGYDLCLFGREHCRREFLETGGQVGRMADYHNGEEHSSL